MTINNIATDVYWLANCHQHVISAFSASTIDDMNEVLRFILRNNELLCLKATNGNKDFVIMVALQQSQLGHVVASIDDLAISHWSNTKMIHHLVNNIVQELSIVETTRNTLKRAKPAMQQRRGPRINAPLVTSSPELRSKIQNKNNTARSQFLPIQQEWGLICKHCHANFLKSSSPGLLKKCCQSGVAIQEGSQYPKLLPLPDAMVLLLTKFGSHMSPNSSLYNTMLSFASTGLVGKSTFNHDVVGDTAMKLQGHVNYRINIARSGSTPSGGTSYFIFDQRVHQDMNTHIMFLNGGGRRRASHTMQQIDSMESIDEEVIAQHP